MTTTLSLQCLRHRHGFSHARGTAVLGYAGMPGSGPDTSGASFVFWGSTLSHIDAPHPGSLPGTEHMGSGVPHGLRVKPYLMTNQPCVATSGQRTTQVCDIKHSLALWRPRWSCICMLSPPGENSIRYVRAEETAVWEVEPVCQELGARALQSRLNS